jgi:hypothetical protein
VKDRASLTTPPTAAPSERARADKEGMSQHPRVTIGWAIAGLETAITKLDDGPAERRVRAQFHQLLLALERARLPIDVQHPEKMDAQLSAWD